MAPEQHPGGLASGHHLVDVGQRCADGLLTLDRLEPWAVDSLSAGLDLNVLKDTYNYGCFFLACLD